MSAQVYGKNTFIQSGHVLGSGDLVDSKGQTQGKVSLTGELFDKNGRKISQITHNGQILSAHGALTQLHLKESGEIYINDRFVGTVKIPWGMRLPKLHTAFGATYLIQISDQKEVAL